MPLADLPCRLGAWATSARGKERDGRLSRLEVLAVCPRDRSGDRSRRHAALPDHRRSLVRLGRLRNPAVRQRDLARVRLDLRPPAAEEVRRHDRLNVRLELGNPVRLADGAQRTLDDVVIDASTGSVTHIVVQAENDPDGARLVPMELAEESTNGQLSLR